MIPTTLSWAISKRMMKTGLKLTQGRARTFHQLHLGQTNWSTYHKKKWCLTRIASRQNSRSLTTTSRSRVTTWLQMLFRKRSFLFTATTIITSQTQMTKASTRRKQINGSTSWIEPRKKQEWSLCGGLPTSKRWCAASSSTSSTVSTPKSRTSEDRWSARTLLKSGGWNSKTSLTTPNSSAWFLQRASSSVSGTLAWWCSFSTQ